MSDKKYLISEILKLMRHMNVEQLQRLKWKLERT